MKLAVLRGRAAVRTGTSGFHDVEEATEGRFGPELQDVLDRWDEFREFAATRTFTGARTLDIADSDLDAPVGRPRQIFAIGLNYVEHAQETRLAVPESPAVFTKFASSIAAPHCTVALPSETVDWEVELVVTVGRGGREISRESAWSHVAGLSVGQDLSERTAQFTGANPQFSMAKSMQNFAPIGPYLVTPDELDDPADLRLVCTLNGEEVQNESTKAMVDDVSELIRKLSAVVELQAGDLIFTGTPAGVGFGSTPPRYLADGDILESRIAGIGSLRQLFVG